MAGNGAMEVFTGIKICHDKLVVEGGVLVFPPKCSFLFLDSFGPLWWLIDEPFPLFPEGLQTRLIVTHFSLWVNFFHAKETCMCHVIKSWQLICSFQPGTKSSTARYQSAAQWYLWFMQCLLEEINSIFVHRPYFAFTDAFEWNPEVTWPESTHDTSTCSDLVYTLRPLPHPPGRTGKGGFLPRVLR